MSKQPWSIRYGGFILIGFGLLTIYAMLPTIKLALNESTWASAQCKIISAKLISDEYGIDSLDLRYQFVIGDRTHQGTLYETKNNVSRSEQFYRNVLKELQPERIVNCFYDPMKPDSAVINRVTYEDCYALIVPMLFISIGIFSLLFPLGNVKMH